MIAAIVLAGWLQLAAEPRQQARDALEKATHLAASVSSRGRLHLLMDITSLWADTQDPGAVAGIRGLMPAAGRIWDSMVRAHILTKMARYQVLVKDREGALKTLDEAEKLTKNAIGLWGGFWQSWESEMPMPQLPGLKPADLKPLMLSKISRARAAAEDGHTWAEGREKADNLSKPAEPGGLDRARKQVAEASIWKPREKDEAVAWLTMELAKAGQLEEARQTYRKIGQEESRSLALRYLSYLDVKSGDRTGALVRIDAEKSAAAKVYGWVGVAEALLGRPRPKMYFPDESGWRVVFDDL